MSKLEAINPESWGEPKGYANGVLAPASGRLLFVAGQIGWDENQKIVSDDFALQFAQALSNVVTVVRAAGGQPEHIARLTIYVTDKQLYLADLKGIGASYRELRSRVCSSQARWLKSKRQRWCHDKRSETSRRRVDPSGEVPRPGDA